MKENELIMTDTQMAPRNPRSKGGLPLSAQMEEFSYAYIHAVASSVGYELDESHTDYQSIDVSVKSAKLLENVSVPDPQIRFQLKSTTQNLINGNSISYPLEIKNYNDLRAKTKTPRVLLLVILPDDPDEWIIHDDFTHLKTCGYFRFLRDEPETTNSTSINVTIPIDNVFTKDILHDWMCRIAGGETL